MTGAVYLTGVPGVGKSSVLRRLQDLRPHDLQVFSYSEHLSARLGRSREELRAMSSRVVAAQAVSSVDLELAEYVARHRSNSLVVVDSHAVTDEAFGHRIIPFAPSVLASLSLDAIVCLVAQPETIAARVAANPGGRPPRTIAQVESTQRLQEVVAVSYATALGIPLYVVDVNGGLEDAVDAVGSVLMRAVRV